MIYPINTLSNIIFRKSKLFQYFISTLFLFLFASNISSQTPEGIWKTIDDVSGEAKSYVEIFKNKDNTYSGKIIKLLDANAATMCEKCTGSEKGKPLVGLIILKKMETYRDYWKNGTIFDPKSGNTYGCSMWFEEKNYNELKVRGKHWSGLFRDQTWYKVK